MKSSEYVMLYGLHSKKFAIKATIMSAKQLQNISNQNNLKIYFTKAVQSFTDRQLQAD